MQYIIDGFIIEKLVGTDKSEAFMSMYFERMKDLTNKFVDSYSSAHSYNKELLTIIADVFTGNRSVDDIAIENYPSEEVNKIMSDSDLADAFDLMINDYNKKIYDLYRDKLPQEVKDEINTYLDEYDKLQRQEQLDNMQIMMSQLNALNQQEQMLQTAMNEIQVPSVANNDLPPA